jgi:hypothetical protein
MEAANEMKYSLLLGNGINNVDGDNSWDQLIHKIGDFCKIEFKIDADRKKHFPLLYEEIFLCTARKTGMTELRLKKFIGTQVSTVKGNDLHEKFRSLRTTDILTTNYEFSIAGQPPTANSGIIQETRYSIFRHYRIGNKKVWHIHGDCMYPQTINLGFEHYVGQLQMIRNYVVSGPEYKGMSNNPLIHRLNNNEFRYLSWIDLFFKTDLHIIGLTLDYVETDLWWLLTYRARLIIEKRHRINNRIVYYIPKKFAKDVKYKLDLLSATSVDVQIIDKTDREFYQEILKNFS